jgi:hypothetical protein
MGCSILTRIDA